MIGPGTGVRVYLACGVTDMRKGVEGLAAIAQDVLGQKPSAVRSLPSADGAGIALD
jgi:transposase